MKQSEHSKAWVDHTYEVLIASGEIEKSIIEMETGERGYIITGKEDFLENYKIGKRNFFIKIEKQKIKVSDNPPQVKRLVKIENLITQWVDDVSERAIKMRKQLDVEKSDVSEVK